MRVLAGEDVPLQHKIFTSRWTLPVAARYEQSVLGIGVQRGLDSGDRRNPGN
jgi:hypothetical protein